MVPKMNLVSAYEFGIGMVHKPWKFTYISVAVAVAIVPSLLISIKYGP